MEKILGVDLGTNSIGLTLREGEEFSWYGVYTFKKGVGEGKSGEFSYAAERTKHRSSRRLYNARRYRKWETLKVLIENDFCPLSIEELNNWKNYKKDKGRVYPVDNILFQKWISLDFNNDGKSDYTSPYQLRRQLINDKLDLAVSINRHKLGRALYHIAQRRGFKSSRKSGANEKTAVYKGSNETKTIGRDEYESLIIQHGSLGAAFAFLEDNDIRVRNRYTLRSDYYNEVEAILEHQNIKDLNFREAILQSIFYQRPLRSQKGLIGKCTLETNKPRCPISHPQFEEYRAWSFLNNIKYRKEQTNEFEPLPLALKEKIFYEKFFLKRNFKFGDIRKFIMQNGERNWELNYSQRMDNTTIPTCIVSARFKSVFGDNWKNFCKSSVRYDKKDLKYNVQYSIEDIWHILYSYEDEEIFEEFLISQLNLNESQISELKTLFNSFPVGYANLSLKAINNILPFLRQGYIYSDAVILAKIPEIIGNKLFEDNKEGILEAIENKTKEINEEKNIVNITNNLIFKYFALDWNERFAVKDATYILNESDKKDVETASSEHFGNKTWQCMDEKYKSHILAQVEKKYQKFFTNTKREHFKQPQLVNSIKNFIAENFNISTKQIDKIYHPSQVNIYPKTEDQNFLNSPKTAAFKNPMAYKTLYKLRDVINFLIETGKIDEETRIVVEIARELNDSNKRWAIEKYQRDRENENREFAIAISELIKDPEFQGIADPNNSTDNEKLRLWIEQSENYDEVIKTLQNIDKDRKLSINEKDVQKYRLWKEQNCICMYTGKTINLTDLFDNNKIDFEHTIPRSKSFDNSLANMTVCFADYNRNIKKNKLPTELPNYENEALGYSPIKRRLKQWEERVDNLYRQIDFWAFKSKTALDKNLKDEAIRQRHLRKIQYDYWKNKVDRFTRTDIPQGFVNSQLSDTQIITKYAYHYLKTVFNKVETIKGSVTAEFRKIYNIQPKNVLSKDREKHYHHAIDAAVLTLLPSAKKREEILKRKYQFEESNHGKMYHIKPFKNFNYSLIKEIEDNILINNMTDKDNTITPAKKIIRKRGRIVWIDKERRIPKFAQGDSIRGELHLQTYYGKIKIAAKDDNGSLLRDEKGNIIYNQVNGKDEIWMVIRKPIESVNFSTDIIVDKHLELFIKDQIGRGIKPYNLVDFQGNTIRRLRCRVKAARGFMNPDNATLVKEQVYKSKKDYKNYIWADSGDNYLFGLYENEKGRQIISINKMEAAYYISKVENNPCKKDLFKQKEPVYIKNVEASLIHIFEVGQKVIFYENFKEELQDLERNELSPRLYFVKTLFDIRAQRILFQHHLEARSNEQLLSDYPREKYGTKGKDGFSKFSSDFLAPRLLLTPRNFNFIIENKDFLFNLDGTIKFNF